MRNLRKLTAVVIAVALVLTSMTAAFAASTFTYEDQATVLNELSIMKGDTTGDLMLDKELSRTEGAIFVLKLLGKSEADMEAADTSVLADFADAEDVPEWAEGWMALAVSEKVIKGSEANDGTLTLDAEAPLLGKAFSSMLMNAFGYAEENVYDESVEMLADLSAGTLLADIAADIEDEVLTRDVASAVLFDALQVTAKDADETVIEAYVGDDADLKAIAEEAGLIAEAAALEIDSVTATKVNTLKIAFNKAVDTTDITLKVTKGTAAVEAAAPVWNTEKTEATLTTTAKMTNGTYTVTATSTADTEFKATGSTEVVSQYVKEIKILNETALTGTSAKAADRAYVYYDVLDQYGESLKTSTNIEWSFSVVKDRDDKNAGKLTLKRSDGSPFTYGEKIYVTGVYAKTGISVTATLSVGAAQALNSIEVAGYVKKGTNEILKSLPSDFKARTYYLIYNAFDQNGNPITAVDPVTNNEVTFISDNVLLIKEIVGNRITPQETNETVLTIDDVEYNAVFVTPGINVSKGGEVNITAIANKTGYKTVINTAVGEDRILTSFSMSAPSSIISDGGDVVIPFVAKDQNGEDITNFVTLAKQATFNKLTFTTSSGTLKLSEKDDGTAELKYDEPDLLWSDSQTTDGIDRTVSLTSVVVGGDTSSQLLYIQDKARPDAIKAVDIDNVLIERGSDSIALADITFLDQYGREMSDTAAGDFFRDSKIAGTLKGTDFAGFDYIVRATFKGDSGYFTGNNVPLVQDSALELSNTSGNLTLAVPAGATPVGSSKTGFSVKFEIAKYKADDHNAATTDDGFAAAEAVSTAKSEPFTIVDISAVRGYTISDLNKFYVRTTNTINETGDSTVIGTNIYGTAGFIEIPTVTTTTDYKQKVEVKGTYNGETVTVPVAYYTVSGDKLTDTDADAKIDNVTGTALKWNDLYDATSARYVRKDATDTLKVTILNTTGAAIDSVSKEIKISDATPKAATINTVADEFTISPENTVITIADIIGKLDGDSNDKYYVKDQYGIKLYVGANAAITYKVSSVEANAAGYADNNFKANGNDTSNANIEGAERGDKFVLTIKVGDATKDIKFTVGADKNANISGNTNNYLDELINGVDDPAIVNVAPNDYHDGLEIQRNSGLN